jgi:hypothetical protein
MNRAHTATLLFLHNRFYQLFDTSGAFCPVAALTSAPLRPLI